MIRDIWNVFRLAVQSNFDPTASGRNLSVVVLCRPDPIGESKCTEEPAGFALGGDEQGTFTRSEEGGDHVEEGRGAGSGTCSAAGIQYAA